MDLIELILGPKCVDCRGRIKGPKYPVHVEEASNRERWLCPPCKAKRDVAEERRKQGVLRRQEEEQLQREAKERLRHEKE